MPPLGRRDLGTEANMVLSFPKPNKALIQTLSVSCFPILFQAI